MQQYRNSRQSLRVRVVRFQNYESMIIIRLLVFGVAYEEILLTNTNAGGGAITNFINFWSLLVRNCIRWCIVRKMYVGYAGCVTAAGRANSWSMVWRQIVQQSEYRINTLASTLAEVARGQRGSLWGCKVSTHLALPGPSAAAACTACRSLWRCSWLRLS